MTDKPGCSHVFWNLLFLVDLGGVIGLVLMAFERWPWLINRLELLFYGAGCLGVVVLGLCFIAAQAFGPKRGVNINGCHYEDFWSDR